jgi:hypothetical protein
MGILDDAIREHLELKRRHGASEEELRQQEVEALGDTGEAAPDEPPSPEEATAEPATELLDGNGGAPEAELEPELEEELPEAEPELLAEPEPEPLPEPEAELEPEPEVHEEPARAGDTPPRGFEPVDEPAPEDEADEEGDVLEDTPDFLQETPEHDRLWFEQKPPRDFDFD